MIIIAAKVVVRSECVQQFKDLLPPLIGACRNDEGCIGYEVYESVDSPCGYFFFEKWATQQDFDEQLQTKHVQDFLSAAQPLLTAPAEIKQYSVAGIGPK